MRLFSLEPEGALAYQFRRFRAAGHTLQTATDMARRELERKPVQRLRDAHGRFPAFTSIGGYSMVYLTKRGNVLCSACASDDERNEDDPVIDGDVHWEGPSHYCDDCSEEIESSYGDPEDDSDDDESEGDEVSRV